MTATLSAIARFFRSTPADVLCLLDEYELGALYDEECAEVQVHATEA